ncbi:hypothetical protein GXP67_24120 [Rhodocytophaga rosea]|uniref:Uncharacterized protein n=1 Tax=Rhodocytophaga rosea TaxID=2704465 RepID=A0A6C0GNA3_9BACT|nr:hypothetical protein [Rhodocytophaga rosea]QHT69509.1 hypothetical protein GXP67_24120 [Rhodocytophaga rosea]
MSATRKILPLLIFWLTISVCGLAQNKSDFVVNKGEVVIQMIPLEERYRFPQFEPGEVYFRNNTFIKATLNYNLLYGEMQFINHQGDTLALKGEYRTKLITIGKHVFFYAYKTGYLEVVSSYPQVKLAKKQTMELTGSEVPLKSYSMDAPLITGLESYGSPGSVLKGEDWNLLELYTQKAPGDLYFEKKTTYIIIDKNDRFYEVTKATVLKLFPKHKKAIDAYINEYNPDFNLRNDVQGLLAFCSQLDAQ